MKNICSASLSFTTHITGFMCENSMRKYIVKTTLSYSIPNSSLVLKITFLYWGLRITQYIYIYIVFPFWIPQVRKKNLFIPHVCRYSHILTQVREAWRLLLITDREQLQDKQSFMKYLHTHTAQLNNLEVNEVGLHSPQRVTVRLRRQKTPTEEVFFFLPSLILTIHTFSPSLLSSTSWPPGKVGENEREGEREIRNTGTRQESLQINRLVWETW